MLVFNEGLPRSGKSYDAVKSHILPALKAGRKVYARINGLDHQKIAVVLEMDVQTVRDLLVLVNTADVNKIFIAERTTGGENEGEWGIADDLKNALFVIDECHEFYVASRESINPGIEQFFALCGQNGMDGLLLSQWYRRLHSSVRARIERKNVFQKLTAVGMDESYNVTRYHTISPDRFEKIGTETLKYDAEIFALYKGYAVGASNTAVYKAGGKTVWAKIRVYALVVVPVVVIGLYMLHHFFGADSGLAKSSAHHVSGSGQYTTGAPTLAGGSTPAASHLEAPKHPHGKLTEGQGYIWDLSDQARPRLLAVATTEGGRVAGLIEWRPDQGAPLERLTFDQLKDLGVSVEKHAYGVRLVAGKDSIIVTAWPLDNPPPAAPAPDDKTQSPQLAQAGQGSHDGQGVPWPSGTGKQDYTPPGTPGSWHSDPFGDRGALKPSAL
jgi:zona occludens toxin